MLRRISARLQGIFDDVAAARDCGFDAYVHPYICASVCTRHNKGNVLSARSLIFIDNGMWTRPCG